MQPIESIVQDLRFATRMLRRSPAFLAVALCVIAVGIGANATTFSLLSALCVRTLPVRDPARLVVVSKAPERSPDGGRLTPAESRQYQERASCFSGVAAQDWEWTWLSDGERSSEWQGGRVSHNHFDVLGVSPHLGRFFVPGDDSSSVVLSHAAWTRTFDGDPGALGRVLRLNRRPHTVIGVAPREFAGIYVGDSLDAWTVASEPGGYVVGRLAPRRSVGDARAELAGLAARLPPPAADTGRSRYRQSGSRGTPMARASGVGP